MVVAFSDKNNYELNSVPFVLKLQYLMKSTIMLPKT